MQPLSEGRYLGRPIRQVTTAQVLVVESAYKEGAVLKSHSHARSHFCVVLEGGYDERLGRSTESRGAGAVSFLPAGCEHAERHLTPGRHLMIEPSDAIIADVRRIARMPNVPTTLTARSAARLGTRLARELRRPDPATPIMIDAIAAELLGELCRHDAARDPAEDARRWVACVRETVDADPTGAHSLAAIGRLVGRHPVHVARSFRRHFGVSLGAYVRRRRVDWASNALKNSDTPIAVIAAGAGFSDQSHFTRWCRVYLGQPPSAIRRRR